MNEIELRRMLKIPDPEASTIKGVLTRMGYPLVDLDRLDHFLIGVDGEVTQDIVSSVSECLVNPNKHFSLISGQEYNHERFERGYNAKVFVEADTDPEAINALGILRERFGYGDRVEYVRRQVVWGINFDSSLGRESVKDYVTRLVSEPTYFFANPNFQKLRVEVQTYA